MQGRGIEGQNSIIAYDCVNVSFALLSRYQGQTSARDLKFFHTCTTTFTPSSDSILNAKKAQRSHTKRACFIICDYNLLITDNDTIFSYSINFPETTQVLSKK